MGMFAAASLSDTNRMPPPRVWHRLDRLHYSRGRAGPEGDSAYRTVLARRPEYRRWLQPFNHRNYAGGIFNRNSVGRRAYSYNTRRRVDANDRLRHYQANRQRQVLSQRRSKRRVRQPYTLPSTIMRDL
ncbi:uncharacterized protein LOC112046211 [Bicyclus anynana]|uniref:Uncharacterized protein LOC112046211 n=1 Tax=Bicyclus anynana TaxID=110368 RepID=A0A6J1N6E2_BICAN|nr:uncharacterized protein LOC112046211 [Bicyclus anynana]